MDSEEDKIQEKKMAQNKKIQKINQGLIQLRQKKRKKSKKRSEPSSDKSGSGTKTKTERTKEQDS